MPSSPVIFLSSGFLGPNRDGNQSITNTIIGFLESGYRVFHFSFVSERDSSFDFRRLKAFVNYHHFGFPGWVLAFFRRLNRLSIRNRPCRPVPADSESVDPGLTEITWKQNAAIVACTLAEFCRMAFASLIVRPGLFYGYEVSGIFAAYGLARLTSKKCVTRFQGTYVTERNMHLPVMALHVAALRLKAHGLVINNDGTRGDVIAQRLGIAQERLFFRPNGLDDRLFEYRKNPEDNRVSMRAAINTSSSKFVAGVFTRFYPYKRVDQSLYLLERFLKKNISLHLAIGGDGPLAGALRHLAGERNIEKHVTWCGPLSYEEMPSYYTACDVVFHLNDYANINNQTLEAICLGIPLLAIDDGYNSKMFGDCPFARFIQKEELETISWEEIEKLIAKRGSPYSSPHIRSWKERMKEEIVWIEQLQERRGGT